MDLKHYTEKAQEALVQAQSLAGEYSHGQIEGEHLLLALLRQPDGVVPLIVQGLGLQAGTLAQQIEGELAAQGPGIRWGDPGWPVARSVRRRCDRAEKLAKEMHDDFVSTEHLLLALADERAGNAARLLQSLWPDRGRHPAGADWHPGQPAGHLPDAGEHLPGAGQVRPRPDRPGPRRASWIRSSAVTRRSGG